MAREISTEQAAVAFGLLGGVAGGLAQVIGGRRLSQIQKDTVEVRHLLPGAVLGLTGTVVGAFMLPRAIERRRTGA